LLYCRLTHESGEKIIGQKVSLLRNNKGATATIPKGWLLRLEEQEGKRVAALDMEATDCLTFKPIFEQNKGNNPHESTR
jgi:hypothetical protein